MKQLSKGAGPIVQPSCTGKGLILPARIKKTGEMEIHEHACGCAAHCGGEGQGDKKTCARLLSSTLLLLGGLAFQWTDSAFFRAEWVALCWFLVGWLPVAVPVMREAWETIRKCDVFNEFTLMLVASLGAFYIGEYPEALAVMLFYSVGEWFQDKAVDKARHHIKALLDVRPQTATVLRNGQWVNVMPDEVAIGEEIEVKAGERVPLDGIMVEGAASFNTAALTGESVPRSIGAGEEVLAGMIPADRVVHIRDDTCGPGRAYPHGAPVHGQCAFAYSRHGAACCFAESTGRTVHPQVCPCLYACSDGVGRAFGAGALGVGLFPSGFCV